MTTVGTRDTDDGLVAVAQAYADRWFPYRETTGERIAGRAGIEPRWDEVYCRRVADFFDRARTFSVDTDLSRRYQRFKQENLRQFDTIVDSGIQVEPWRGNGQPYHRSARLRSHVRSTGVLYFYPTSSGHGSGPVSAHHPMREASGMTAGGLELSHNDIFRVVHDIFGHVMFDNSFSARGEFKASYCHMWMYSEDVHPVLFTEQIAQICWYFFGPHSAGRNTGGVRSSPLSRYPEQKVFEFPAQFLDEFMSLFNTDATEEPT